MLEDFACRNGLPNPTHFTDDGVSGTRFDRPGFLAMMEEVEAGRVEAIVIKDMSRLGRDYLNNIMNEFYARDTSRKIRSVFKSKGMSGKHLTGTVIYGGRWFICRTSRCATRCGPASAPAHHPRYGK